MAKAKDISNAFKRDGFEVRNESTSHLARGTYRVVVTHPEDDTFRMSIMVRSATDDILSARLIHGEIWRMEHDTYWIEDLIEDTLNHFAKEEV